MHTSTVLLLAVAVLCNCSDPITISPLGDVLISKSSNDNVTFNCTFLTTTGHDSSSILWKIGNATLLDRDQYAGFGVNALDSAHRNFSQLFLSPPGRVWLFNEIEEMNISIQCLGSERNFIVTERGPIFSLVVCGTVPKVRALRVDLLNGWSVVSWNRPSIFQPLVLTYNVVITDENGMKLNESNTTGREVTLPMDFKCDKCQVSVKAQNDNCDVSETAVWDMGPIPICITIAPFTRSSIEYTCNDDENQKAMVNFPEANGAAVVNRTVTVTASGVLINVSETGNTGSVEITGLIKQSRYYVVVTMCTDRCCQETKAVTLSTSCVKYCSVKYFRTFAGIRCKFSEVEDASSNDTGVQLVFTINGEETTINISRESAIAGYSPSQILISGIDVRSYDWNPKTGTTGSLPVETSITTVTSREDFDFSSAGPKYDSHTPDASSSKEGSKFSVFGAVGLTLSLTFITAFILGATFVLALHYCLPRRRRSRRYPSAAQEVTEAAVIYDLPTDLVRVNESDPDTRDNTAYIVSNGVPTTNNPAYGKVHR